MSAKRIFAGVAVAGVLSVAIVYFLIDRWCETPYGRLDPRVAVYLKLTGAGSEIPNGKAFSIQESRKRLEKSAASVSGSPVEMASVSNMQATYGGLTVPVRVYRPVKQGTLPVVVFYHGGGWVQGSLDTHDGLCRILAKKSGALVVSVDYRLAPEHVFPAAVNDAYAVLNWVSTQGQQLDIDTTKIAVAGDSAGGTIAAAVCLMTRDRKGPVVVFQALIYPGVNAANLNTESYKLFAKGFMLDKSNVERFIGMYIPNAKNRTNPYASPMLAKSHAGLPPALVITADFDVLRDEGEAYAKKLKDAGVPARSMRYPGMIHAFVSAPRLLPQAGQATDEIAAAMRNAFLSKQ